MHIYFFSLQKIFLQIVLWLIALLCSTLQMHAQPTPLNKLMVRRITTNDGLLANQVYSIYQDSKGYMWFGGKGMQRYDGYQFKTYVPFDFPQLISYVVDDVDNNIYFGVGADLAYPTAMYVLNTATDSFRIFQDSIVIQGVKQKLLLAHSPIKAKDGTIWFALYPNAYAVLQPHAKQLKVVSDNWRLQESIHYRHTFEFWNDQYIWQSNPKDGIYRIDINNYTITTATNNVKKEKIFDYKSEPMLNFSVDKDTNFWTVLWDGDGRNFCHVNHKTFEKKVFSFLRPNQIGTENIHQILHDKKGNIWITPSGHSGLARYNPQLDVLDFMYVNTSAENKLRHQFAFGAAGMNIFIDKDRNIWYPGDGVQFFNPSGQQIVSYANANILNDIKATATQKENINTGSTIDAVQMANKDIYISYCVAGLIKLDSNGNNPVNIDLQIPFDCLRKMFTPDGINLYIKDSYTKNMYIYNTNTKTVKLLQNDYLNTANITKTYVESDTAIWIANKDKELVMYNPKKNIIQKIPNINWPHELEWNVRSIMPEGKNGLWLSITFNGMILIDKYTGKTLQKFVPDMPNYFNKSDKNAIMNIARWNRDSLILSTLEGLIIYNTKTKSQKKISIQQGLLDNYLAYCIADTFRKKLWINSVYQGLFTYNMLTGTSVRPVTEEGNYLNIGLRTGLQLSNDDLMFFFASGICTIKQDKKFVNYAPNNVLITDMIVNGVSQKIDGIIHENGTIKLPEYVNDIKINFSCLDYWSNKSIQYFSYLEGLDTGFTSIGNKAQLSYNGLASGNYTLHIKAAYLNGNFCKQETILRFAILPPFYKTWWFIVLLLSLASYALYYFLKTRNETKLNIANLKNDQLQSKLQIEEINNFFNTSLLKTNKVEEVLWDVSKNLISKLNLEDCMIFLCNDNKTQLTQVAGYGLEVEENRLKHTPIVLKIGEGIVGSAALTKTAIIVADTSTDARYIKFGERRASEIAVPIIFENELYGIIDCENSKINFYSQYHLNMLTTIASIVANKIKSIESETQLHAIENEVLQINQQLAEVQLSALRSQMNPHFIFNSLNSINSVVVEGNIALASDYLTKFSRLIRLILENSKSAFIPLSKEIEAIRLYLLMENIRFKKKFDYELIVDGIIDEDDISIPPTTIQPFVENAIVHGLMHLSSKGFLTVKVRLKNSEELIIEIIDNGVGRIKAGALKSSTNSNKSYGLQITKERIMQLHKNNSIEIFDKVDENLEARGTIVIIKMYL